MQLGIDFALKRMVDPAGLSGNFLIKLWDIQGTFISFSISLFISISRSLSFFYDIYLSVSFLLCIADQLLGACDATSKRTSYKGNYISK